MAVSSEIRVEPGSALWWEAHLRRLGRRRPRAGGLTVERLVEEALELVDGDGLDCLTVRRLASRLGTSSATLYRHVASVDELLVLVIDRVLGEIQPPPDGLEPREQVIHHALELRRALVRHPGVVPALRSAPLLGPNAMRSAALGLTYLLAMGLEPERAVPGYLAFIDFTLGAVYFDTAGGISAFEGDYQQVEAVFSANERHFQASSSDQVFRLGVTSLLDGLRNASNDH